MKRTGDEISMYHVPNPESCLEPATPGEIEYSEKPDPEPFQLLERRLIVRNAAFSVYLDHLRQPDGREIDDYLSVVPLCATEDLVTGVAVLPEQGGRLVMVRVHRHPLGAALWEVPRGFVDAGETPAQAAVRELREETGLVVAEERLLPLGMVAPEPGLVAARVQLFAALACSSGAAGQVELGHLGVRFFSPEEVGELIAKGEIQDPCTLVAHFAFAQRGGPREFVR